jgi:hypothetical protein
VPVIQRDMHIKPELLFVLRHFPRFVALCHGCPNKAQIRAVRPIWQELVHLQLPDAGRTSVTMK